VARTPTRTSTRRCRSCLVDTSGLADTEALRQAARALEPGRTRDYRIPLGPLVAGAGLESEVVPVSLFEVQLEVVSSPGNAAWIEAGRTWMDGCP
jgi:hypothetical protein